MFGQLLRALGIFAREYARETMRDLGVLSHADDNGASDSVSPQVYAPDAIDHALFYGPTPANELFGTGDGR